jgi:rhodanese-related sulfurtransferase
MATPWWFPFGRVAEVTPAALAEALADDAAPQLLDVRTPAEFSAGHIPGSRSLPITALSSRLAEAGLDPGRPVVAICLTAHRSIPAVRLLRRHGFDAAQLAGGMLAWRALRLPEVRGRP